MEQILVIPNQHDKPFSKNLPAAGTVSLDCSSAIQTPHLLNKFVLTALFFDFLMTLEYQSLITTATSHMKPVTYLVVAIGFPSSISQA